MGNILDVTSLSDLDLANGVNALEGFSWRINHDAADGRIEDNKEVDKSLKELQERKNLLVEEIKRRTGLSSFQELKTYINQKIQEQEAIWDRDWAKISTPGTVFSIKPRESDKPSEKPVLLETLRAYLPAHGTIGPQQYTLAVIRGTPNFRVFDDREVTNLIIHPDIPPQYKKDKLIITANSEKDKRRIAKYNPSPKLNWKDFKYQGLIFTHAGFNDTFERFTYFNLPNSEPCEENEVVLARAYSREALVEFTRKDLGAIVLIGGNPKFVKETNRHSCAGLRHFSLDSC